MSKASFSFTLPGTAPRPAPSVPSGPGPELAMNPVLPADSVDPKSGVVNLKSGVDRAKVQISL